jgi:hypothetical protein
VSTVSLVKAPTPIEVTELGMTADVIAEPSNA